MGHSRASHAHRSSGRAHHSAANAHHRTMHKTHVSSRKERDLSYCHKLTHRNVMRNSRCRALMRDERRHATHTTAHVSISKIRRQMRWCGKMSDREMLRHSTCRELMGAHAPTHHKATSRHHATRHATRHRRR